MGISGVYVRVRIADVRAIRLENRQSFTGLVSSILTLSAKLWRFQHTTLYTGQLQVALSPRLGARLP
jgi:hypothetical protein